MDHFSRFSASLKWSPAQATTPGVRTLCRAATHPSAEVPIMSRNPDGGTVGREIDLGFSLFVVFTCRPAREDHEEREAKVNLPPHCPAVRVSRHYRDLSRRMRGCAAKSSHSRRCGLRRAPFERG